MTTILLDKPNEKYVLLLDLSLPHFTLLPSLLLLIVNFYCRKYPRSTTRCVPKPDRCVPKPDRCLRCFATTLTPGHPDCPVLSSCSQCVVSLANALHFLPHLLFYTPSSLKYIIKGHFCFLQSFIPLCILPHPEAGLPNCSSHLPSCPRHYSIAIH